jgi:hypothetical protein
MLVTVGFQATLGTLEAQRGVTDIRRSECQARLFTAVFNLSRVRIRGRLRFLVEGKRQNKPLAKRKPPASLYLDVCDLVNKHVLNDVSMGPNGENIKAALEGFRSALEHFCNGYKASRSTTSVEELMKQAVIACDRLSTCKTKSLEQLLEDQGISFPAKILRAVKQIDQVGRYWSIPRFFTKLVGQPRLRRLFRNVTLQPHQAFPIRLPLGATNLCRVHAEIQLVLHYEQEPPHRPPRAIGASKSACYLCSSFIQHHGGYLVTHAHNVLYPKWTLPEVPWMTAEQIQRYRGIITRMQIDMQGILQQPPLPVILGGNIESQAHLPRFVLPSVASTRTTIQQFPSHSALPTPPESVRTITATSPDRPGTSSMISTAEEFSSSDSEDETESETEEMTMPA